jgi:hypothetical protein
MGRYRDNFRFAVQFFGSIYLLLWPVSTPGHGEPFGGAFVCDVALAFACRLPHPLHFGIGVHLAGALCAVLTLGGFATRVMSRAHRRRPPPPRKWVRPRSQFGLRGVPH